MPPLTLKEPPTSPTNRKAKDNESFITYEEMRIKNSHLFSFIYLLIFSYCGYRIAILWWVVCAFSVIFKM